jgi:zona occludens toxin
MITILQGTLGSGKSATCIAMALEHLKSGGVVATNFKMVDGWAMELAKHSFSGRFFPDRRLVNAQSHYDRHFHVSSLDAIKAINPKELAVRDLASDGNYKEGQGLLILDECQLIFNSRKWEKNMDWIEFFTQTRKLGWNVVLVAHTVDMIDSQIRPLIEFEARFRNLQKVRIPLLGLPLAPFPCFMIVYRYAGLGPGASNIAKKDVVPLPMWAARLYDSLEVFSREGWGGSSLPSKCGSRPAPSLGGGVGKIYSSCRSSSLSGPHWDDYLMTLPVGDK